MTVRARAFAAFTEMKEFLYTYCGAAVVIAVVKSCLGSSADRASNC